MTENNIAKGIAVALILNQAKEKAQERLNSYKTDKPINFVADKGFIRNETPYIFQTNEELNEWASMPDVSKHSIFSFPPDLPYAFSILFKHYGIPFGTASKETNNEGEHSSTIAEITSSAFDGLSFVDMQRKFYELTGLDFTDITYEKIQELEQSDK